MKTISVVNLKGGVGKTVTAVNLAGILAADYGKRVLLVDSDPQGDASQYIGVVPDACSTADLFDGGSAYYEDVIQHTIYRDLDIIPSDMQLASVDLDADIDRKQAVRVYADLRDALVEDDAYDVMIFDCPPSFSLPCISAIAASDTVIVPIKPGAFEMAGMRLLADQIASVRSTGLAWRCVVGLLTIWHNADGCEKVCGVVKQRITSAKDAETRKAERQQREDAFMKSPLAMARRYIKLALAGVGITSYEDLEGFPKRWYMDWLWHDPLGCPAPDLDDLFRLADWAGVDPFEMIAGHPACSIWHKYTEERPPEGARVLCNLCGCAGRYGEYIYKGGKWYFPDLDDEECEANILVSAWTEVFPE